MEVDIPEDVTGNECEDGMQGEDGATEQQEGAAYLLLSSVEGYSASLPSAAALDSIARLGTTVDVKFCHEELQFLHDNFEAAEGATLARSLIYSLYLQHCRRARIEPPMNAASFGKLLRLVFTGIRTRRLGTRGHSKYHYHGVRLRRDSRLSRPAAGGGAVVLGEQSLTSGLDGAGEDHEGVEARQEAGQDEGQEEELSAMDRQHMAFLGDASCYEPHSCALEVGDNELLPEGLSVHLLTAFQLSYQEHCEDILHAASRLQLKVIPDMWTGFWMAAQTFTNIGYDEETARELLRVVGGVECVQRFVREADYQLYAALIDLLMPDVLRPIPNTLRLVLRNFSKNLEGWLLQSTIGVPEGMIQAKMAAVCALTQLLRRHTGLNHIAQAARTVLHNSAHCARMLHDLSNVNFVHIQEEAALVCGCDATLVLQLEGGVRRTLAQRATLDDWAAWLDGVATHLLQPHAGHADFAHAARQLLLKWSFCTSLVLRDVMLMTGSSFGALQLLRLLCDEYLAYAVEHKVAAATGVLAIAALGNVKQFIDGSSVPALDVFSAEPYQQPVSDRFRFSSACSAAADSTAASAADADSTAAINTAALVYIPHLLTASANQQADADCEADL